MGKLKEKSKNGIKSKPGKNFEDNVADTFRLLGADVVQNIEICNKKVDSYATFSLPGSAGKHRIIIESKDENKARNQNTRVMQFKGLLDIARKAGEAESASIITKVPWSDQAKGFAKDSGIELLTYEEKIAQLIDLKPYMRRIIDKYAKIDPERPTEPPLKSYYVDMKAKRKASGGKGKNDIIDHLVNAWIELKGPGQLAILGEWGTGKSSFCMKLAHDLAKQCLENPGSTRIPLLFNLRDFTKALDIESLITHFLDHDCGVLNPRFTLFQAMNDAGLFLIILDGFDEMAVRVDSDTIEMNLREIEKLASSAKTKIILTTRTEYFTSIEEEGRALFPKGELLATRHIEYEPIIIEPWGIPEIENFIEKRVLLIKKAKKPWTFYRDRINKMAGLSDLARRPVLLDMIVKTLPALVTSRKKINSAILYDTYLRGEIKRQRIIKARQLVLPEDRRFQLLRHTAKSYYTGDIKSITLKSAKLSIEKYIKSADMDLEAVARDFLTCSFLIRQGNEYQFSHRSIMEYLVACVIKEELEENAPSVAMNHPLNPVIIAFLSELKPKLASLWSWVEKSKASTKEKINFLGGNAVSILVRMDPDILSGKDLSGLYLRGAKLVGVNLQNTKLSKCLIEDSNMCSARFLKNNIMETQLRETSISVCLITDVVFIRNVGVKNDPWDEIKRLVSDAGATLRSITVSEKNGNGAMIIEVAPNDPTQIESLRTLFTRQKWCIKVLIYADEFDEGYRKWRYPIYDEAYDQPELPF